MLFGLLSAPEQEQNYNICLGLRTREAFRLYRWDIVEGPGWLWHVGIISMNNGGPGAPQTIGRSPYGFYTEGVSYRHFVLCHNLQII